MFDNSDPPEDRNQAILSLLVKMAVVDQNLEGIEKQYLLHVAGKLGLTVEEVKEVLNDPDRFQLHPPPEEHERMLILYHLLFIMRIDGEVRPREEEFCYKAGLALGFHHSMVTDLIRVMKKYLHEEIPPDAMINEVKKYMN